MAEKTETTKPYEVLSPLKAGGKRYAPGAIVQFTVDEAAKLAELQIVSAKPVKPSKVADATSEGSEGKQDGSE